MCVLTRGGKKGPSGQPMTDYFLQLLKKNVPSAQPCETLGRWDTGWGVAGLAPAAQVSAGSQGSFRGRTSPRSQQVRAGKSRGVICVANTRRSATGRLLSVEECREGGGRGGR